MKGNKNRRATNRQEITKIIQQTASRHSVWNVFSDWVEMMAINISNSCDKVHYKE